MTILGKFVVDAYLRYAVCRLLRHHHDDAPTCLGHGWLRHTAMVPVGGDNYACPQCGATVWFPP